MSEQIDDADWLTQGWPGEESESRAAVVEAPTLVADEPDEAEDEDRDQEETPEEADEESGDDEAAEADDDEQAEESDDDDQQEGDEEDAFVTALANVEDPDVKAFLSQYDNDPLKALQAAAHLRRAFDRQGTDLGQVRARVQELEEAQSRQRLLGGLQPLSEEQHQWAESAAQTPTPGAYVQQAIEAGEYELARAVCSYWGREAPYEAARAGFAVDDAESRAREVTQAPAEASTADIIDALKANVPGFREWEPQIVAVFENLGPTHHLVQEARSNNVDVAMRALINLYEIAQASSASVREQRDEIRKRARKESASAKAQAAVTSASNSTGTAKETPRGDTLLLPGLTLEDLDTEFARHS